jgi:hypothetical protein
MPLALAIKLMDGSYDVAIWLHGLNSDNVSLKMLL